MNNAELWAVHDRIVKNMDNPSAEAQYKQICDKLINAGEVMRLKGKYRRGNT